MKTNLSVVAMGMSLLLLCSCYRDARESLNVKLAWRQSDAFQEASRKLALNPEAAMRLLLETIPEEKLKGYYRGGPLFLAGDFYAFGIAGKIDAPLTGFYVNGNTQRIEYRSSSGRVTPDTKSIPRGVYTEIRLVESRENRVGP